MERTDLSKLDITEVIMRIGLYLSTIDIIQCFTDEKIMQQLFAQQYQMNQYDIVDFIKRNQKSFNMNRFIFANYLMISGVKEIPQIDLNSKITNRELKKKAIEEHLKQHPIVLIDADGTTMLAKVYDSRDYSSEESAKEHLAEIKAGLKRIEEIDSKLNIENFLFVQILTDINAVYSKIPDLGNAIRENIIVNTYKNDQGMTNEKLLKILNGNISEEKPYAEYMPHFLKELQEKAEYIDWDKFLLVSAYRIKETLEKRTLDTISKEEAEFAVKMLNTALECIKNPNARINSQIEILEGGRKKSKI